MKIPNILLVEDDPDDIELFQEALNDTGKLHKVSNVMQGDLVMPSLENDNEKPDLIVLDLNLPKLQGKEILASLKKNRAYRNIPVIILTTSSSRQDIDDCLNAGAIQFITKPVDSRGFKQMAESIFSVL
jgi:CheY-like chemotaxis protein